MAARTVWIAVASLALVMVGCGSVDGGVHVDRADQLSAASPTYPPTTIAGPSTVPITVPTTTAPPATTVVPETTVPVSTMAPETTVPSETTVPADASVALAFEQFAAPYECTWYLVSVAESEVYDENGEFGDDDWPMVQAVVQPAFLAYAEATTFLADSLATYAWPGELQASVAQLTGALRTEATWYAGFGSVATLAEWDAYPDLDMPDYNYWEVRESLAVPAPAPDMTVCDGVAG